MLIIPLSIIDLDNFSGETIGESTRSYTAVPRVEYLFTQFRAVVTYMRLLFVPSGQNLDYDYPLYTSFFEPAVFLSFAFLLGIFGFGIYLYYRSRITDHSSRLIAFGIFWFFITLSVESSVMPIRDLIAEHRIYLPSVGAFMAVATAAFVLLGRIGNRKLKTVAVLSFVLILSVFSYAAYARNAVWKSGISLWSDVVKKSPMKAGGHMELGIACKSGGLMGEAVKHYRTALMLEPNWADAHYNLGIAYLEQGQIEKAYREFKITLELRPDFAGVRRFIDHIEKYNR